MTVQTDPSQASKGARGLFARRHIRVLGGLLVVAAVGVGAYFVAAGLSGGAGTPASASLSTPSAVHPGRLSPTGPSGRLGRNNAVTGTVQSVGTSSFTVATRQGTVVTVEVTSSTTFTGTSLSSLKKGDVVFVLGSTGASGAFDATRVSSGVGGPSGPAGFGGRGGFGRRGVFGSVSSIASSSFDISGFNGASYTVKVSSSTTFSDASGSLAGLSALKDGEDVIVGGTVSGDTVTATTVRVVEPGTGFGGGGFGGGFGGGGFGGGTSAS